MNSAVEVGPVAQPLPSPGAPSAPPEFSLVLGGPLYQLWRRTHLSGDALELLRRRLIVLTLFSWVPLLALSIIEGHAWGSSVQLPFLYDIDLHARLLLALPLLVGSEIFIHLRMRKIVSRFLERGLVPDSVRTQFDAAVASALRLRDSVTAEVILLAFVYVVGVAFVWRTEIALDISSWYGLTVEGKLQPSLAGWWLGCVSLPIFQFLLLRWYFRLFIFAQFLWRVSRIELNIMPLHPDRCGGLGFLGTVVSAFAPFLLAQGTVLAGMMANRILYRGATLLDFKVDVAGLVTGMVLVTLTPLLVFSPKLAAAKRRVKYEYGSLAQRYVGEFDRKWFRKGAAPGEPLIGSADIQSLADLWNSFEAVQGMRFAPFGLHAVLQLAAITLIPFVPLLLTMLSPTQLLDKILQVFF